MKFKMIDDRIAVSLIPETKSKGGIVLPDNQKPSVVRGHVVVTGPGRWSDAGRCLMQVNSGDEVLFKKGSAESVTVDGETYYVLHESGVLALFPKAVK